MVPEGVNCVPVNAGALLVPAGVIAEMLPVGVRMALVVLGLALVALRAVSYTHLTLPTIYSV